METMSFELSVVSGVGVPWGRIGTMESTSFVLSISTGEGVSDGREKSVKSAASRDLVTPLENSSVERPVYMETHVVFDVMNE